MPGREVSFKTYSLTSSRAILKDEVYINVILNANKINVGSSLSTLFPFAKEITFRNESYYRIKDVNNKTVFITDADGLNVIYGDVLPYTFDNYIIVDGVAEYKETLYVYLDSGLPYLFYTTVIIDGYTYLQYFNEDKKVILIEKIEEVFPAN